MHNNTYNVGDLILVKYYYPDMHIVGTIVELRKEAVEFIAYNDVVGAIPTHLSRCYASLGRVTNIEDYLDDYCESNIP